MVANTIAKGEKVFKDLAEKDLLSTVIYTADMEAFYFDPEHTKEVPAEDEVMLRLFLGGVTVCKVAEGVTTYAKPCGYAPATHTFSFPTVGE